MAAMTWKKWRIGLWIAIVFGLLNAGAGLVADISWKAFLAVLCMSLATNLGAYLMKHPVESVQDTTVMHKDSGDTFTHLGLILLLGALVGLVGGCGTTFEQRLVGYKAVVQFGVGAITNGTVTNIVGTVRQLKE